MKTRFALGLIVFFVSWALLPRRPLQAQVVAIGGSETNDYLDYRLHIFTGVGGHTFEVSDGGLVDVLVVGGGGGGGATMGGGGGAGGLIYTSAYTLAIGEYGVVVGDGGLGGFAYNLAGQAGQSGTNSSFGAELIAIGGGGGSGWSGHPSTSGGSGGGGNSTMAASTGTVGQGFAGDIGSSASGQRSGGGGGGASEKGGLGVAGSGGKGGDGIEIFGQYYAGGGGGGLDGTPLSSSGGGAGGLGGGGAGSRGTTKAIDATPNTGGGGGGAGYNTTGTGRIGGHGGSGIVIVRYPYPLLGVLAGEPTDIGLTHATLHGRVGGVGGAENPDVYVCWGEADAGTGGTGDWHTVISIGNELGVGEYFSHDVLTFEPNRTYVYRAYVTNTTGVAWSEKIELSTGRPIYVATNATPSAPYDSWANGFTNLQDALEYAVEYDTLYLAGQVFDGDPLGADHPDNTVFRLQSVSNLTLRGGYQATSGSGDAPGPHDPDLYPTVLSRNSGDARILTVSAVSNALIEQITIRDGSPYGHRIPAYGGGVFLSASADVVFSRCHLIDNECRANSSHGGALFLSGSRAMLTNCVLTGNQAVRGMTDRSSSSPGGALYVNATSELHIRNSVISNNLSQAAYAAGYGGALYVAAGGVLDIKETVIAENRVNGSGTNNEGYGGGAVNYGTLHLRNCLIVSNLSNTGHSDGFYTAGGLTLVENCTVADNHTVGLRHAAGTTAVTNSILWNQTVDLMGFPSDAEGVLSNVWYSCIGDGQNAGHQGCHSLDPLFADRITYHLQSSEGHYTNGYFSGGLWTNSVDNSPLIDRGDSASDWSRETAPNGGRINMGAYGNTETASLTPSVSASLPGVTNLGAGLTGHRTTVLQAEILNAGGETPETWFAYWAVGDSTTNSVSAGLRPVGAFSSQVSELTPGVTYHFKAYAANSAGTAMTAAAAFTLHPSDSSMYVATNGNHTAGTNWVTAYRDLDTVWALAETGDTIYLAGHTFSNRLLNARDPSFNVAHPYNTVFLWRDATNITLRGGYAATNDAALPGARDSLTTPTIISRVTDDARVLTLIGLSNCVIDQVTIRNGSPYGHRINAYGGGIFFSTCEDVTLTDCRIIENEVRANTSHGGGLYLAGSRITLTGCDVVSNQTVNGMTDRTSTSPGGGVYVDGSSRMTATTSMFLDNRAEGRNRDGFGGGFYVAAGGELNISESVIAGNYVRGQGLDNNGYGGAIVNYGALYFHNCLISSNESSTTHSDGLYLGSGSATIENCTLADNHAVGIRYAGGAAALTNTIVWGHTYDLMSFPTDGGGNLSNVWYSCIGDGQNAGYQGCVSLDPVFADRITYHLRSNQGHYTNGYFSGGFWTNSVDNSPLIDRGDPASDWSRETIPNGGRINMGAYGNTEVAARTPVIVATLPGVTNLGPGLTGHRLTSLRGQVTDSGGDIPETWFAYWNAGGATNTIPMGLQSSAFSRQVNDLTPGQVVHYQVYAENAAGTSVSAQASVTLHPTPSSLYVATNGNHTLGAGWSTAYTDLDTAWDFAEPGDTIYLAGHTFADGFIGTRDPDIGFAHPYNTVFLWTNAVDVGMYGGYAATNDSLLPGARNAAVWPTVLTRATADSARILTMLNASNCVIDGVTLRDGAPFGSRIAAHGGGVYVYNSLAVVFASCRIVDNSCRGNFDDGVNGGGLAFAGSQGQVMDSLVDGNRAWRAQTDRQAGACGAGIHVNSASELLVRNSRISNNSSEGYYNHGRGGGLFVAAGGILDVQNTVIDGNQVSGHTTGKQGYGGALANNGVLVLRNGLIVSNVSNTAHSDGVYAESGLTVLENCTIADNNLSVGVRYGGGALAITNTIVWGHTDDLLDLPVDGSGHFTSVTASLFNTPIMDGVNGCIAADPRFVDSAIGNYRLRNAHGAGDPATTSPAIDAGVNHPWMSSAVELDGHRRIMMGLMFSTLTVDLGAYEAIPPRGSMIRIR